MHVERSLRGFQRRHAIVIVERIEDRQMQNRRGRLAHCEAHRRPARAIFVSLRPALRAGNDFHPVGTQRVQLAHFLEHAHALEIGVAGDEQITRELLDQVRAGLARIRFLKKLEQRVFVVFARAFI